MPVPTRYFPAFRAVTPRGTWHRHGQDGAFVGRCAGTGCRRLHRAMSLGRNSMAVMLGLCSPLPPLRVCRGAMTAGDRLGRVLSGGGYAAGSCASFPGAPALLWVAGWDREPPDLPCARLYGACAPMHADVPSPLAVGGARVPRPGGARYHRASCRHTRSGCQRRPASGDRALIRTSFGRRRTLQRPGWRGPRRPPGPWPGSSEGCAGPGLRARG